MRLPRFLRRRKHYAQGGYIGGATGIVLPLSRGHAFVTTKQIAMFGGWDELRKAFPDIDFELLITAEEAREAGQRALEEFGGC